MKNVVDCIKRSRVLKVKVYYRLVCKKFTKILRERPFFQGSVVYGYPYCTYCESGKKGNYQMILLIFISRLRTGRL